MQRPGAVDDVREIRHFHLFCGLGGGAKGFQKANRNPPRVGNMVGRFRCIGGIDVSVPAIRDFEKLTGTRGTVMDLFDRDQFRDFHGMEAPREWKEVGPVDIRVAAGGEYPHIVFLSAPCKGFSGLLAEGKSKTAKYQALNRLTLRGVWVMLEAFADNPPELIVFENVPRIANRGRFLLDQINGLLTQYGYAVAETAHDCGELGGLAQSRKRFLLVSRHMAKVPPFLYEPEKKRLQAVGTVLDRMPLPGDSAGGPMHRVPFLQFKTWLRLAFVRAGADWRSLNELAVEDGVLRDYLIVPEERRPDYLGVTRWDQHAGAVSGRGGPTNGRYSVADPRYQGAEYQQYGVRNWDKPMGAVSGQSAPGGGAYSVADPRMPKNDGRHLNMFRVTDYGQESKTIAGIQQVGSGAACVSDPRMPGVRHNNVFRVVAYDKESATVTGGTGPSAGGIGVADPRPALNANAHQNIYRVVGWDTHSKTVAGASHVAGGALSVADPRGGENPADLHGKYPVAPWGEPSRTVIAGNANGAYAVADPRPNWDRHSGNLSVMEWESFSKTVIAGGKGVQGGWLSVADPRMPAATDKLVAVIRSMDGTWHRPFTTLELAALQSLIEPEEFLELDGLSDSAWRERIGNAVPPDAAEAIARVMGTTLLLAWSGETFVLSATPIWVRPVAVALSVASANNM